MLLLLTVLSFLSRSVLSISTLSPVCPASCQAFLPPSAASPHALTLSSVPLLGPDSIPLSPSIPTSGPLEPQLVLIRRGRGKTVHWGLKRDVNSPLANRAPLLSPACVSTREQPETWERKERWAVGRTRGTTREGRISPGGSIGVAQRYSRGSMLEELALPGPPPSTSCPRASDGQDQKDNSGEEGGSKRQLS